MVSFEIVVICLPNFLEYRSTKAWTMSGMSSCRCLKWWNRDGEDIEPIVKVLPKATLANLFLKVSIGCCHDSNVNFDGMGRTQALKLVMLNYPQQFDLQLQRQLPDFV